jgi:TolA-binding protein
VSLECDFISSRNNCRFVRTLFLAFSIFISFNCLIPSQSFSQQSSQYEEVIFGLTLKELGSYNITVAVKNDKVYLPIIELFNIFEVYYTIQGQNIVKGTYLTSSNPMKIDPVKHEILLGENQYVLTLDEMFKGDMDIYISTEKYDEIFGITSTVNINRLQIIAETNKELPAVIRKKNALVRTEMGSSVGPSVKYPLRYALDRSFVNGAVLDYSITSSLDKFTSKSTNYTITGGGEIAGGDIQGSLAGITGQSASLSDLRWRYVMRGNNYFSSLTAGQITTGSSFIQKVDGIAVSNEPIEPRVMFDNYVVDGFTDPQSDVELYLNDRLIGFQKTNAAGYYRFQFPLTYGTEKITLKTFSKYGDINVSEKQIQVPFSFVPKGILSYNIQTGKVHSSYGLLDNSYFGSGNLLYGATNWLTLNGGLEHSTNTGLEKPIYNFGFSSRLFSQYILNIQAAPDAYYRLDANALFASNAGVFASYAKYVLNDSLIGATPQESASLAVYLPLAFISSGTGFRISEDYRDALLGRNLATRLDFSTRFINLQLLVGYVESKNGTDINPLNLKGDGVMTATVMYMMPSISMIPKFLRAFLVRSVAVYDLQEKAIQDLTVQFSKTFMQIFQFNLGVNRNFLRNTISYEAGLIMDLNFVRTSSVFDFSNESSTSRQSLYGSMAIDRGGVILSNREQIGKGGIDVVLFVDNNSNGKYDAGDELIPARGVKVDGMGKVELGRDSIIRVTQLESYFRYNLEVDRQQIDPNLVPVIDKFSFVVDPNQMRKVEIPFYRGGIISGNVYFDKQGNRVPLSGGRIIMRSTKGAFADTLRTFADGGFYAMNVAPGNYTLVVDPVQLQFLQVVQQDGPLSVTVHRSLQGDIVEDLVIVCESLIKEPKPTLVVDTTKAIAKDTIKEVIASPPVKRESNDSTILKEYTEPVTIPVQKEQIDTTHKEIAETLSQPVVELKRESFLQEEYSEAVSLFREKKYQQALAKFNSVLTKGIEKVYPGNCEYWIGECYFAARDYSQAIAYFQKVLAFESSNKKVDAYYMLGKAFDQAGEEEKAFDTYQVFLEQYPTNIHAQRVKERLKALSKILH